MYTFRKGPTRKTVIIDEDYCASPPMDEETLRMAILNTQLQREKFASEEHYLNSLLMFERALKFLLEEQA